MAKEDQKALTKRSDDQSVWYTEVVQRAGLADYSPVRGCMVIKPYGYELWENIQTQMNKMIKAAGVKNAYFPIFIPYSFLQKEADHVEGFAPEVAIVTHAGGAELEEKLVVRPTSETMIYHMFSEWIQSYRDLPLKINQWANVVRWEKRTTPFLRTTEFLWQEGHTAHADKESADTEVIRALEMYYDFVTEYLAMHVIKGYKTEAEKFAGAEYTTTIEAMMGDKKALQSGTSHLLGQSFSDSFGIMYLAQDGVQKSVRTTSWGFSTRIIGGVILMHGDDKGLVMPPKIAPVQAIIVPIVRDETKDAVNSFVAQVEALLRDSSEMSNHSAAEIRFETDNSENSPGFKFAESEMRGIPVRIEIGGKDVEAGVVTMVNRVNGNKEQVALNNVRSRLTELLGEIQTEILSRSRAFTEANSITVSSEAEFKQAIENEAGFIYAFFNGDKELEKKIKEETKYGTRCIPFETFEQEGKCIWTGETGKLTIFAKAY